MRRPLIIFILLTCSACVTAQKADTLKHHVTKQWKLSGDYTQDDTIPVDTSFSLYHRYRRMDKYSAFNVYPGNYGLPFYQMNFFDRITDPDKFLYRNFYPLMHMPDNAIFMNTQVPFTEMVFGYAGPRDRAEQTFRVRHSQNINRFMNIGLVYDIVYSLGQYSYQNASDKTFALNFSYSGNKYKAYFQAGINHISTLENGGISDPGQLSTFDTKNVQVKLGSPNNAQNSMKDWNILLVQKLVLNRQPASKAVTVKTDSILTLLSKPGTVRSDSAKLLITKKDTVGPGASKVPLPKADSIRADSAGANTARADSAKNKVSYNGARLNGVISHILIWDKVRSSYSDAYPQGGFYDTTYVNKSVTFDTLSVHVLKNTVRFDFSTNERRKFRLGGGFGIRNELYSYTQYVLGPITPDINSFDWKRNNNIVLGRLFNNIGSKFRWGGDGELYLTGYRAGDFRVKGDITRDFDFKKGRAEWNITGGVTNLTPSDWFQHWYGNNFRWNNSFNREIRIDAGTEFLYPARRMALRFNYAIINNYTYFGADAMPAQYSGALSVASAFVKKEFSAWKFHLHNEVLMQVSSNKNVLDLPLITLRSGGFFEHNFHFKITNGYLLAQAGVDVLYNTQYHGYGWMPAISAYYQQQTVSTGNYPYLSAFLNIKIKRTRIFIMLDHLNSGLNGYNYFMVPGYPMNIRCFRYGLAWTFYD